MPVTVTFRQVRPTEALRRHAESKAQRLQKFLRHPIDAHVVLSVLKHRHIAELVVTADRMSFTATEETGDLYSAIDLAIAKLERQVAKRIAKRKTRKHDGAAEAPSFAPEPRSRRRRGTVIETERVTVKPMSVDEGVMQMNLLKKDFFLFKNAATDTLGVIYRRRDGNYGLIEPEMP
ncbi:MAG TPA: ribosome-associated translation inhibitor RaiA [Candidatus Kryptonia bacterium]|nr:ribosome-associated translation inhibitor RaiA [Candidatus Kryptonia bacterium]